MGAEATLATRSTDVTLRVAHALPLLWEAFRLQNPAPLSAAERVLLDAPRAMASPGTPADEVAASVAELLGSVRVMLDDAVPFTDRALREINSLFGTGVELVECARDALLTENRVLVRHMLAAGTHHAQLANDYAMAHQQRLDDGVCLPRASAVYLGMLEHLKGVGQHTRRIAEELAVRHLPATAAY
jgi:hypothetical protein